MVMKHTFFKWLMPCFCILFAFSAQADTLKFKGDYVFSWSGIRIGKLQLELKENDKEYSALSTLKTAGLVAAFSDHKSVTKVKGKTQPDRYQPSEYRSDYFSGNKDKVIALKYGKDGTVVEEAFTPPKRASRPDVPAKMKMGAADSLTAIFSMRHEIKQALKDGRSKMTVPVFDGKRRFDLHARVIDPNTSLRLDGKSVPAVKLGLRREAVAGFKQKELKKMAKGEPELEFFIEKKHYTLLGLQMPLYGGTVMAWVKNACTNEMCNRAQFASK